MNLKKVHHIAIIGSNYEQSKHFYVGLLGFSIIRENYRPERDDYKIDLQLDEMELELFIIKNCPKRPSYPEAYGLRHLAFAVDSVDNTVRELKNGTPHSRYFSDELGALFIYNNIEHMFTCLLTYGIIFIWKKCRSGVQRNVAGNRTRISISDPCDGSNAGPYPPVTGL